MVEQDPDNMVETTSCQPTSDLSIEGFFMNIIAVNRNVKLIPATLLLQMDRCMSESGKENRKLSNDSKLTKKKRRTRSEGPQGRQPLHETTNKIKDFKVPLDTGSILLTKLRNTTDCNIKNFPPDMEVLKFQSCRGEKRKGKSADGNKEIDNKNLKLSTRKITNKENRDDCTDSQISESTNRRRTRSTSAGFSQEARSTDDGSKVKEVNPRKRTKTDETDTKRAKETRETREKGKNEPKEIDNKNLKSSTKKITNKENRDDCADSQISESTNRRRSRSTSAGVSREARSTDDGSKVKEATTRKRTKTDETDTRKAKETRETREKGKNEPEDSILEQILNVSCNTSMTLRPYRQYYWMRKMFEDADESWELPYKRKKTSTTKLAKRNNNKETEKKQKEKKEKGVEKKTEKNKSNAGKKTKGETKEGKKKSESVKAQSGTSSQVKEVIQKPEGKKKNVIAKGKNTKEETKEGKKKSESVKAQSGTSSQVKEVIQKPEDVVITAKRGTLKYLKQRETYVKAVAKEAECEDDFFVAKDFTKKSKLSDLLLMDSSESLTIKTPQGKGQSPTDGVITPRTSLLGHWGVTKETSTVYTPSTRTPKTSKTLAEKTAIIQTIFHQLQGRGGGRRRGARKLEDDDELAFESMLHNTKTSVVELPELPEVSGLDDGDSSDDDYFNTSDAY